MPAVSETVTDETRGGDPSQLSRKDKAFNFGACAVDAIGFPLGNAFFSTTTLLPVFLVSLKAGDIAVGTLQSVINLLTYLPGLFVVDYLRKLPRTRSFLFWIAVLERVVLLPLAFLTPLWAFKHNDWLLYAVFVCMGLNAATMGINLPAYWVVIGKCIPVNWRGRLFGYSGGVGGLLGVVAENLLRTVVFAGPNGGFPNGFARGFWIGFLVLMVSVLPLALVREPISHPEPVRDGDPTNLWQRIPIWAKLWHDDPLFRQFLQAQFVFVLAQMATPFLVLHARALGASATDNSRYTAATIIASAAGNLVWGALADRIGNPKTLLAATVVTLSGIVAALALRSPATFLIVFSLWHFGFGGIWIAANNQVLEMAGDSRKIPLYTVFYNVATSLPRAAAPLIGGLIARAAGYPTLFVTAGVCIATALVLLNRQRVRAKVQG